jgi:tetratricopeptide (TPR) repeat protein
MLQISKWDLDVETDDEEEYTSLARAVRRTYQRFKLLFVSCSPSQGEKIRGDLMADVPTKKYELLDIKESINNLYEAINNIPNLAELDVLFVRGLEYSIFEYEDQEFGDISKRSQSRVYGGSWAGVPPVLAKLNMQRELFRDRFPQICFVFLLPHFAIDYFIRRAPDFYDWKSGIYRFETDTIDLQLQVNRISHSEGYEKYIQLTIEEKLAKITEIRACLDETNDLEIRCQLLYQLAFVYMTCDQFLPALIALDNSLEINPKNDCNWTNRGSMLDRLGRYEEAITSYDRSLQVNPKNDYAWYNRGVVLDRLGEYEEAITSYDRSLQIKPDNATAWVSRGNALSKLGRYKEAVTNYNRGLHFKSNNDKAWNSYGNVLDKLGKYHDAFISYNHAVQINSNNDDAWYRRGIALSNLGRDEEAIASYDHSLELKPDNEIAWHYRGIALSKLGRYEEAITSYDHGIEINSDNETAWTGRGFALSKLGRYEEAITSYDHALQIKPDNGNVWHYRGIALSNLGRDEEAIASYDHSVEIKSDNEIAWYYRGISLNKLCRYDEAITSHAHGRFLKCLRTSN